MRSFWRSHRSRGAAIGLAALIIGCSCSDGNKTVDAARDTTTGDGPCGADRFLTGELVDWASTDASFCGIFNAKLQVVGDAARQDTTAPNGRFELCIARAATTRLDVTPATMASPCSSMPGTYTMPGILIVAAEVIDSGGYYSARMITSQQIQQQGLTLDPAKGHVLVHVDGTPRAVTLSAAHDAPLRFDGMTWTAGNNGRDVFFPNVDTTGGMTSVQLPAPVLGPGAVPLVAGSITLTTLVAQ